MKRAVIDRETVQKIIDTADIVEVVSDFVHLQRRGANYIGLCPFHNERTPSFSVSRAKGICKCFSCGKGGSPVNFIMEHEQLGYWEALKYLARKYHIEVQERELTDAERAEQNARQGMMAVNEFAMEHFRKNMQETPDGREIGMAYFRERGINDWAMERFKLGYSMESRDDLYKAARAQGHSDKYLVDTGLCIRSDRGRIYDRFKGRVMYPIFTISGKVVGFGGRTLKTDKTVAKYVNSPESIIYSKKNELYGLFQAKSAIVKKDKCILVEGYMDVISMHQSGVENVVASSGTSLTPGQIRLIHRFTQNVTVIYDSDPAGIKASLRGIDMLLAEGLDIKVLLLPEGDDPDSFAQSHSSAEVEEYLAENEVDFIRFKTDILLKDCADDPVKRANAIADIVRSIAMIPVEIKRQVYIKECSLSFGIDETMILRQVAKDIASNREKKARETEREKAQESLKNGPGVMPDDEVARRMAEEQADREAAAAGVTAQPVTPQPVVSGGAAQGLMSRTRASVLEPQERALLRIVLKYGMLDLGQDFVEGEEKAEPVKVIDFVADDLAMDNMGFTNPLYHRIFERALALRDNSWESDYAQHWQGACERRKAALEEGIAKLRETASDLTEIKAGETLLNERVAKSFEEDLRNFAMSYFERLLTYDADDEIRSAVTDMVVERHQLSRIFTKYNQVGDADDRRLDELVPRALIALKYDAARCSFEELRQQIAQMQKQPDYDLEEVFRLMALQRKWQQFCSELASHLGERVYEPLR